MNISITHKKYLSIALIMGLLFILPVAVFISQKHQEIRSKAQVASAPHSDLTIIGPSQVKVGEKFSVDVILDTANDPDYTISSADALVSVGPNGAPTPNPSCIPSPCVYGPMPPDFCKGGKIVYQKPVNSCGICPPSPICIMPADDTKPGPTTEPELTVDKSQQNYPMPPVYRQTISFLNVSPGNIFENYSYPGSVGVACGGFAGRKCPDGYYCSYGGNIRMGYPDQGGTCIPNIYPLPMMANGGSSQATPSAGTANSTLNVVCTQDAKQCPDGSWVGRTGSRCEFASCSGELKRPVPIGKPPYYGNNQFEVSGVKTFAVDENGYFKGFTGKGIFATLNFVANYAGKAEIKLIYNGDDVLIGSHIKGYSKNQSAQSQSPQERLLAASQSLNIEVVGESTPTPTCIPASTPAPSCTDNKSLPCIYSPPPPGTRICPPASVTPSSGSGCSRKKEGDANCDGVIDGLDYSVWINTQCHPFANQKCGDTRADFNGDGKVDDEDYIIWFNNRGK